MSVKIGIVCEGISDYRILQHITERYLRDLDAYTIPLKPKETRQGAQVSHSLSVRQSNQE